MSGKTSLLFLLMFLEIGACVFRAELDHENLQLSCVEDCPAGLVCLKQSEAVSGFCVLPDRPCISVEGQFASIEPDGNACGTGMICLQGACVQPRCGDGIVSGAETCDGQEGCRTDCTSCGDGIIDGAWSESCDNGSQNSDIDSGACRSNCQLARCGDNTIDPGEGCDDGLQNSDSVAGACRTTCTRATCGDGVRDEGEECDLGDLNNDQISDACRTTCVWSRCGDGTIDESEECDDGFSNSDVQAGACRTNCERASCGDNIIDPGEECDDGRLNSNVYPNVCRIDCSEPRCGDGVVDRGEACDQGLANSDTAPNACRRTCTVPKCGDGVLDDGEGCDSNAPNSGCRPDCTRCGDGHIDFGEACDDGNRNSGDGCREDCLKVEICGDGVLDFGEPCDDGNQNPRDGCDLCRAQDWTPQLVVSGQSQGTDPLQFSFETAFGLTVDREGRLYFSDIWENRVYRIDLDGTLVAVAGSGRNGFSGDFGPAIIADFFIPSGLAVDSFGALWIADQVNNRVRRVFRNHVETVLGESAGVSGVDNDLDAELMFPIDVLIDPAGAVYVSMIGKILRLEVDGTITRIAGNGLSGFSVDGTPALEANIGSVLSMAFDGEERLLFVENSRLRRLRDDGTLETIAGNGTSISGTDGELATAAGLNGPYEVIVEESGRIVISERDANKIRFIRADGTLGTLVGGNSSSTFVEGALAQNVPVEKPTSLSRSPDGGMYYTEDRFIRRITSSGRVHTVAGHLDGTGTKRRWVHALASALTYPSALAWRAASDQGPAELYLADRGLRRIFRRSAQGQLSIYAGTGELGDTGDGGDALSMSMMEPVGLEFDDAGNLYVVDKQAHRIRKIGRDGRVTTIAGTGVAGYTGDGGDARAAQLNAPEAMKWLNDGRILVADAGNRVVRRINLDGRIETIAGGGLEVDYAPGTPAQQVSLIPSGVQAAANGSIYILDWSAAKIHQLKPDGTLHLVQIQSDEPGVQWYPSHIALDASDRIHFSNRWNHRTYRLSSDGTPMALAGSGVGYNFCVTEQPRNDGEDPSAAYFCGITSFIYGGGQRFFAAEVNSIFAQSRVREIETASWVKTVVGPIHPPGPGESAYADLYPPLALYDLHRTGYALDQGETHWQGIVATSELGRLEALSHVESGLSVDVLMGDPEQSDGSLRNIDFAPLLQSGEGIAFDPVARALVITESMEDVFDFTGEGGGALRMVYIDADENSVVDPLHQWTQKRIQTELKQPNGILYDENLDAFWVVERGSHCVSKVDRYGSLLGPEGRPLPQRDGSESEVGVCGVPGSVSGYLNLPTHLLKSQHTGALYVSDTGNHRVLRKDDEGIETVIGDGWIASAGQGSPARVFPIAEPRQMAMDAHGNLYIAGTTAVRMVMNVDGDQDADGDDEVINIFAGQQRNAYPEMDSFCIRALTLHEDDGLYVADGCLGFLVRLQSQRIVAP